MIPIRIQPVTAPKKSSQTSNTLEVRPVNAWMVSSVNATSKARKRGVAFSLDRPLHLARSSIPSIQNSVKWASFRIKTLRYPEAPDAAPSPGNRAVITCLTASLTAQEAFGGKRELPQTKTRSSPIRTVNILPFLRFNSFNPLRSAVPAVPAHILQRLLCRPPKHPPGLIYSRPACRHISYPAVQDLIGHCRTRDALKCLYHL